MCLETIPDTRRSFPKRRNWRMSLWDIVMRKYLLRSITEALTGDSQLARRSYTVWRTSPLSLILNSPYELFSTTTFSRLSLKISKPPCKRMETTSSLATVIPKAGALVFIPNSFSSKSWKLLVANSLFYLPKWAFRLHLWRGNSTRIWTHSQCSYNLFVSLFFVIDW